MFTGHKGVGKTTLAKLIAQVLKAEYTKIDCQMIGVPTDVVGDPTAKDGTVGFALNDFALMCQRLQAEFERDGDPGVIRGVAHFDEFNRAMSDNMTGVHALTDDTRTLSLTTPEGTVTVVVPPTVIIIGTKNPTGGAYTATKKTDAAGRERFEHFYMSWPPSEFEEQLILKRYDIDPMHARQIVAAANQLREALMSGSSGLTHAPSPRRTLSAAMYLAGGLSLRDAIARGLLQDYEGGVGDELAVAREKIRSVVSDIAIITRNGG
jgi:MoxR-like ATPase